MSRHKIVKTDGSFAALVFNSCSSANYAHDTIDAVPVALTECGRLDPTHFFCQPDGSLFCTGVPIVLCLQLHDCH